MKNLLIGLLSFIFIFSLTGCSDSIQKESLENEIIIETQGDNPLVNTKDAIENALWDENVEITINEDSFLYESNGLPNSSYLAEAYMVPKDITGVPSSAGVDISKFEAISSSGSFSDSPISINFSLFPEYVSTTTETPTGKIGVALNGAVFYNDYEDPARTFVALDNNITHDHASFLDECNGHGFDMYHYHGIPKCLTQEVDIQGEHSTMIGILLDGFPIYGNKGIGGIEVKNDDLDKCSGHTEITPEFSEGIYHYHLTDDTAPYSIDCYHGEVEILDNRGPGGNMEAPDLSVVADKLGITQTELEDALGTSRPPDFAAVAASLGISIEKLQEAIGMPIR